jgi:hypothetical protein
MTESPQFCPAAFGAPIDRRAWKRMRLALSTEGDYSGYTDAYLAMVQGPVEKARRPARSPLLLPEPHPED